MKTELVRAASRRGRHRSADEWQSLIETQRRSGQSQAAFCKRAGVSVQSMLNWRRRLQMRELGAHSAVVESPAFVEIASEMRPLDAGMKLRIELGAGIVLELSRA